MSAPPSKQRLQTAVELHQRGELAAAEVIYREILAAEPKQFEAIKMLATIAAQRGNPVAALSLFDEALQLRPSDPTLLNNRGIALVDLGRLNEARDSFKQALELKPDDVGTSRNLGLVLCTLGEQAAAGAHFRRIVELMPKSSQAHCELATALQAAAKYGEARASYRMAIELDPRSIEPHNKLAVMLKDTGNVSEAIDIFKTLISLVPDNDEIYVNFGNALRESGQLIAAEQAYQKAIGLNSDCAEAYNNLGSLLSSLGRLSQAVASFSHAVDLRPDVSSTRSNLLFMLQYLPTPQPGLAETHLAYFRQDRSATVKPYRDWPNALSARAKIADQQSTHESTGSFTAGGSNRLANTLRIGFVSGDLRQHPVGNFLEGVLAELSRRSANRLEVFAYANHFQFDDVSARIKASCSAWHFVHQLPDAVLAEKILLDGIDILIDLSGHSGRNRLPMFNYRPAPVQATWLGYLGTTSVMAMDYLIADAWTLPSELEPDFTEEIWRIPGSYVCFTKPADAPQVGPLPALENGYVTFGCFNNLTKMNDGVIAVWAEILLAVPNSRLMLKAKQFIDDVAKQDVISRFAIHGIEQDRLHLRNLTARVNYLEPYNEIDIALDPFPYPGITTTVESLFMGVPVLTLAGASFLSRQGVGLLSNAGLPQWVAADAETYVSKAIEFSRDLSALDGIRRQLRSQVMASPIFNVPEFAAHFEQAMIGMWQAKMKAKVALNPSEKIHRSPPQEQAVGTQSNPISELVALYRAGSYTEVVRRADVLLKGDPGAGLVWKLLGSALLVQKKPALPALQRACELLPADADAHNNLAAAFHALGHYADAVASYRSALALKPERAETHHNIGISLAKLSKGQAAVTSFRHSIKLNPNAPAVYVSLAFAHRSLGEFTDAAHALKEALRLTPNDSKIRALLADTEFQQGEVQLAIASYRQAIMLRPQDAPTHRALGLALAQSVGSDAALQSLERAVSLAPDDAANHYAIACTLRDLGRLHDAETHLLESIRIQPANADFYVNLGTVRGGLGLASEAELAYREALKIDPQSANAHNNLGNLLVSSGRLDEAFRSFEGAIAFAPGMLGARSNQLFSRQYLSNADSLESQTATKTDACALGGLLANNAKEFLSWPNSNWPVGAGDTLLSRPLRVGMVSGDLRQHPVGDFLVGLLTSLAHSTAGRLELVAYANHLMNDAITRQIRTNCHEWHVVSGLSDLNLAQKINSHGIDVLIDLSGHSGHNRLGALAYKPAPVQASWLGYLGTTGLAAIDYLIADELTLPVADEIFFSEKIWRLPRTYLCFTRPETEASVTPLPALTNGFVTFACFNNLAKMNDLVVACWARIMQLVPQSRLCLKAKQFSEASLRRLTIERFAAHGIDETRLVLKGQAPRHSYLNDYQLVDIALDPFPYPGVTTTVEGLYMGVPALTLGGKSFLARQGIGLLTNAGLPDWIASDHDDYVTRAVALANDIGRLSQVRERLREQVAASPLFDAAEFSRNFEQALRSMWLAKRSF